ncbi:MAG: hypothetical protein JSS56_01990 [Proteobacteria bacterium]|nr:hypothetical protein [Pseudomonadota bacterium]
MQRERLQLEAQPGQAVVIGSTSRDSFGAPTSPGLAKPDKKKKSARTRKSDEFVATYADPHTQPAGKKKKSRK